MVSPTPMYFTGTFSSDWIATAIPPFAVPSIFVRMMPVRSATSPNSLACTSAFCPVVPSNTIRFSLWAFGNSLSMMRFILRSSSIRFFLLCSLPAVSMRSTSTPLAFAAFTASNTTLAGSAPSFPPIMGTSALDAHSAS